MISFNNMTPIIAGSLPLIVSIAGIFKFDTWSQVAFYIGIHVIFIGILFFLYKFVNISMNCSRVSDGIYSLKMTKLYQSLSLLIFFTIPFFITYDFFKILNSKGNSAVIWFACKDIFIFFMIFVMYYFSFIRNGKCNLNGIIIAISVIFAIIGFSSGATMEVLKTESDKLKE